MKNKVKKRKYTSKKVQPMSYKSGSIMYMQKIR